MSKTEEWSALVDALSPHVSPEWTRHAREHGHQGWVRLVALVDAHHQLSMAQITEKVALTMADLAIDREGEREGWLALQDRARSERFALQDRVVEAAPKVLPEPLMAYFDRSIEPTARV